MSRGASSSQLCKYDPEPAEPCCGHKLDPSRQGVMELVGKRHRQERQAILHHRNMKYYVDFAAQSGVPYMMLDAGWSAGRDNYAHEREDRRARAGALCRYEKT